MVQFLYVLSYHPVPHQYVQSRNIAMKDGHKSKKQNQKMEILESVLTSSVTTGKLPNALAPQFSSLYNEHKKKMTPFHWLVMRKWDVQGKALREVPACESTQQMLASLVIPLALAPPSPSPWTREGIRRWQGTSSYSAQAKGLVFMASNCLKSPKFSERCIGAMFGH